MRQRYSVDEGLKKYASASQAKYIDMVNECGSMRAASRKFGVNVSTISKAIERVERVAAYRGYAPGMYAWAAEAGNDFDSEIAERLTIGAIDRLVASAPPSEIGIVAPLGDLMHADDSKNRTPQSGNQLDVDTRHQKVMRIALRAIKHAIYRALEKHLKVVVRVLQGNHDPHAAFAIALALSEHFSNNERVTVDLSPAYFWYYRFGRVLLGLTHGDKARGNDLLGVMATDRAEDWGQTKFRYWYHGHLHNKGVKEMPGVVIEWFRTLAPLDAWAAGDGYRAGRDMCAIVHHKDFGEIERHRCDVAMLEAV
jgi:hypothetical protein